jgi:hypothetical protein
VLPSATGLCRSYQLEASQEHTLVGEQGPSSTCDFFVSYTHIDESWAEWIAWQLEERGYRVLVQKWDFVPGGNWAAQMHKGMSSAARTVAVLSPDYLDSVYGTVEWQAAWAADPAGEQRKLLVVRVRECARPGVLTTVIGTDLYGIAEDAARRRLLESVEKALAGRAKPSKQPPFPGTRPLFPGGLLQGALTSEALSDQIISGKAAQSGRHSIREQLEELYQLSDLLHPAVLVEYQRKILSSRFPGLDDPGQINP